MDTTLVTVTVLSMAMAAALSVIVWRLLRDERQRSEARIAALTEASRLSADAADSVSPSPAAAPSRSGIPKPEASRPGVFRPDVFKPVAPRIDPGERQRVEGPGQSERQRVEGRTPQERRASDDLPLHSVAAPVATSAMFVEPQRSSPWGNRLAVMAGLAMTGAAVVLFAMTAAKTRAAAPATNPAAAAPAAAAAEPAVPRLELLSLRDARQEDTLTITGTVQNPRTGGMLARVAVIAYAFDDTGSFLASGRALLDVTSLAPGDESPFLVTVPVTGSVARYRIGFRSEDGRVIAHVDKRQQTPMAALRQPNG